MPIGATILYVGTIAVLTECLLVAFPGRSWKAILSATNVLGVFFRGTIIAGTSFFGLLVTGELDVFTGKTIWFILGSALLLQRMAYLIHVAFSQERLGSPQLADKNIQGYFFGLQVIGLSLVSITVFILTVRNLAIEFSSLMGVARTDLDALDGIGILLVLLLAVRIRLMILHAHSYFQQRA